MNAHVLLNLPNKFGKKDIRQGLPSIVSLSTTNLIILAIRFYLPYDIKRTLESHYDVKMLRFCHYITLLTY